MIRLQTRSATQRRPSLPLALGLVVVFATSCAGSGEPRGGIAAPRSDGIRGSDSFSKPAPCENLDELVIGAETIVVGKVSGIRPDSASATPSGYRPDVISLEVSEVLKGSAAKSVQFFGDGYGVDGRPEQMTDVPRHEKGDEGIYFLIGFTDARTTRKSYMLENHQARFLRDGDRVKAGHQSQSDGFSREQSRKSYSQLRADIMAAIERTRNHPPSSGYFCGQRRAAEEGPGTGVGR